MHDVINKKKLVFSKLIMDSKKLVFNYDKKA